MTRGARGYDAIVVGGGPAGSSTAALLARDGHNVLLLERAAFPREKACGEYSSPRTEGVLKRIGALDAVEKAGARKLSSMRVITAGGRTFTMDYSAPDDDGPKVLATPRPLLDAALLDHARRCGVEVRERARVTGVTLRDGKVGGVVVHEGRKSYEVQAKLVIGADGVHSVVVRSLGLQAPLKWPRSLGMVARYGRYQGLDEWGEMHLSHHGYGGLAPLAGGVVNVGLVMPMAYVRSLPAGSAVRRFEAFARSIPGVARVLEGAERVSEVIGVGPLGSRVYRTSGPGYLLVGDAAGFFDPLTGEGVYKALRGAELAAQVGSAAISTNVFTSRFLSRYEELRRREFGAKEIVCRLLQLLASRPRVMNYAASRIIDRPQTRRVLTEVVGDLTDAREALRPRFVWSLLRP